MSKEDRARSQIPQGTLDLIVMRTLATMGPQHAYGRNAAYPEGHHGNAILSQHPFTFFA